MSDVSKTNEELIAEARADAALRRTFFKDERAIRPYREGEANQTHAIMDRLADALEAATSERAAVLAPAPDGQVIIPIARIRELRAAKDAAVAAIERVRAIAVRSEVNPLIRITEILAALDGAPDPGAATEERIDRWMLLVGKAVEERMTAEAERDAALAAVERVRALVTEWKHEGPSGPFPDRIAIDVGVEVIEPLLAALDGEPEPEEAEWEYRGRLQSCGYVAEGYISAEHAMNGLKVELEDHPYLQMDDTAIVERARVREWLPVEGENSDE